MTRRERTRSPFSKCVGSNYETDLAIPSEREHLLAIPKQRPVERPHAHQRRLPKPSTAPAVVEIVLFPPDQRRRDLDNYNKALFDALTHAGVWEDDSQVKKMLVEWGPVVPKGKVEITITPFIQGMDICPAVG